VTGSAKGDAKLQHEELEPKYSRMLCKVCNSLKENDIDIPNGVKK